MRFPLNKYAVHRVALEQRQVHFTAKLAVKWTCGPGKGHSKWSLPH